MLRRDAENIVLYYKAIPGMVKLLRQEQQSLEDEYGGLRGTAYDGTPHGGTPGKPTEVQALRVAESGTYERVKEITVRVQVLEADAATIRAALDALSGKYKSLLQMRGQHKYSWGRISTRMCVPDSTARYWYKLALERLAEVLDEVPMIEELQARASRARSL